MQRTAVIYGLALSTLVGAFLLVPRMKQADLPPETPPPTPTPTRTAPVTELVYGDGTLEVIARLDRGYLTRNGSEPMWMDVAIKASGVGVRAPLTSILVVDRSGSMAGDKMDAARMAAERFVRGLQDGDALGVISFGTDVTEDLAVSVIGAGSRARALAVVRRIEEGGGTNIDGAMEAARRMLERAELSGRVGRVVLVSDGRPTEGDRRESTLVAHATGLRERGIVTSTLGLGLDYNEDLMEHMAVEGGGRYYYLREASQLAQMLDAELRQASAVVASDVKIYLPKMLGGLTVADAPGSRVTRGDRVAIDVGDLATGEERHVLVKLTPTSLAGESSTFAAPELVYRKVADRSDGLLAHRADPFRAVITEDAALLDRSRRDDVRVRVLQVEASLALTESMQAYAAGNAAKARARLEEKKAELKRAAASIRSDSLAAEAANLDQVLGAVSSAPAPASADAQDLIKRQKARAFELRR